MQEVLPMNVLLRIKTSEGQLLEHEHVAWGLAHDVTRGAPVTGHDDSRGSSEILRRKAGIARTAYA